MKLHIGRRASFEVADLREASIVYQRERDASGEGASTFPCGRVGKYTVSYNGRVWLGELVVVEAARPDVNLSLHDPSEPDGEVVQCTLAEFLAANEEGIGDDERECVKALQPGEQLTLGGGAAPLVIVTRVD